MDKIIEIREKWQKEYDETSLWSLFTGDDMVATLGEFIDDLDEIIKENKWNSKLEINERIILNSK